MTCNCAEFEILLCDAVDGQLRGEQKSAFEAHRLSCAACSEMAADVLGATAFLERAANVEPPKELLTRILFETTGGKQKAAREKRGLWGKAFSFLGPVLQPKLAMGMAMTILSVSMLGQVFGFEVRQMRDWDLEPAKIWAGIEDGSHRQWSRIVKYYENLRVVFEIQSRLREWSEQSEQDRVEQDRQRQAQEATGKQVRPQQQQTTTPSPGR